MTSTLAAAALAGAATGSRSFTALAAVVDTVPADAARRPDRVLVRPAVKGVLTLLAAQEWVMDKLPQAPSRLEAAGLGARLVAAGGAGALLARRATAAARAALPGEPAGATPGEPASGATGPVGPTLPEVLAAATVAAGTAAAFAWLGVRARAWGSSTFGRDYPVAVLEDAVSLGLALAAVRRET